MLYEVIRTPLIKLTTVAYTHRELRNHSFHFISFNFTSNQTSKFEIRISPSRPSPRAPLIAVVWPLSSQPRTWLTLKPYFERATVSFPDLL